MFEHEFNLIKESLKKSGIDPNFSEEQERAIESAYLRGIRGLNLKLLARPHFSAKAIHNMKEQMMPLF